MKIGILGSGTVGQTLAEGFLKHGHEVMIATREPAKLAGWSQAHPGTKVTGSRETAAFGEVIVLAVKGNVAAQALNAAGRENLAGKAIIDTCNPIADAPPDHGVLPFFTGPNESLMEQLQREFAEAHLVKAFNSVGSANMIDPPFAERPTMFICGNHEGAKKTVAGILDQFGWETADMGTAEAARAIEPLCILWCILGFTKNERTHAFRLLHR
ncbi:MAG TPA: NAD(P)-binding domain-containing protein [Acidobacteriaceae bacterium]